MSDNLDLFGEDPRERWPAPTPPTEPQATSTSNTNQNVPLAERMRPKSLGQVVGQSHLVGPGMPLRRMIEQASLHSLILWGPPGVGKTTLARLLAQASKRHFIALSAVFSGVKDIRQAVEEAKHCQSKGQGCVLFVDEIHRFNKSQQDALLPFVESGLVTFIGATTENPSFEVNSALLSRARVYVLQSLENHHFNYLFKTFKADYKVSWSLSEEALEALAKQADGDARKYLNTLEWLLNELGNPKQEKVFDLRDLQDLLPKSLRLFDKGGDQFYDQISALHKSVRGSDPDAALYWFCRMLEAGTDPKYLARRLVRMAWEDIGLADPRAMSLAADAATAYDRLGSPEGDLALAQCVIYLAVAAKSNAAYTAFNSAMNFVKQNGSAPVPLHLRNAPTALMKDLGYGKNYRYAHNEADGLASGETYWPDSISAQTFYQPTGRGLERQIAEKLQWIKQKNLGE